MVSNNRFILASRRSSPALTNILQFISQDFSFIEKDASQIDASFVDHNLCDLILFPIQDEDWNTTLEQIKKLRVETTSHNYPAIVTAYKNPSREHIDQAMEAGCDSILNIEANPVGLYSQLQTALSLGKCKRELNDCLEKLSRSHDRLRKASVFDELTGLHNAKAIRRILRAEFKRAERYANHLSILSLDIDQFRQINDSYDHMMGSYILSKVGVQINASVRGDLDFTARVGGDEFLVILPETTIDGARAIAQRIQQKIRETIFDNGTHRVQVSMSFGLAHFDGEHGSSTITDPDILLLMAEQDLASNKLVRISSERSCQQSA